MTRRAPTSLRQPGDGEGLMPRQASIILHMGVVKAPLCNSGLSVSHLTEVLLCQSFWQEPPDAFSLAAGSLVVPVCELQHASQALPPAASAVPPPGVSPCLPLQRTQKGHHILLLLVVEFELQDHREELHGVLQGQEPPIMQVGRRVLDAPQREGLDRAVGAGHAPI